MHTLFRIQEADVGRAEPHDEEYIAKMRAKCDTIREDARKSVESKSEESCSGSAELCETQAQLSREATTSPLEALPKEVIMQQSEEWRVAALSIIILAYTWCILPLL